MKKFITILIILFFIFFGLFACTGTQEGINAQNENNTQTNSTDNTENETTTSSLKIAMSTDVGRVNDESFNASAWAGLQRVEEKLGGVSFS